MGEAEPSNPRTCTSFALLLVMLIAFSFSFLLSHHYILKLTLVRGCRASWMVTSKSNRKTVSTSCAPVVPTTDLMTIKPSRVLLRHVECAPAGERVMVVWSSSWAPRGAVGHGCRGRVVAFHHGLVLRSGDTATASASAGFFLRRSRKSGMSISALYASAVAPVVGGFGVAGADVWA
jgi:hypothetical protein